MKKVFSDINKYIMAKGGDFERVISKAFTVWLTGKVKPYKYWRMPGSGGLATIHEECSNLSGDIRALANDAEFLTECFSIECKCGYPSTSFWQHFSNIKNFNLKEFWIQCCNDANKASKFPMLIYRKKRKKPIVGINEYVYQNYFFKKLEELNYIKMSFNIELDSIYLFDFETFLKLITPDDIKEIIGV